MARVTIVKRAQQRYETVPVIDPATGEQKITPVLRRDGSPKTTKKGKEIVLRLSVPDKTRPLPNHTCEKCHVEIAVGDSYKWIKPKSGPYGGRKRYRCLACPSWRPSETTGSSALASIYGAQEAAQDELDAWDGEDLSDVESILTTLAEGLREGASAWREAGENMESGFGHATSMSEELIDKADQMDSTADDVENTSLDDFDEDVPRADGEAEVLAEMLAEHDVLVEMDLATAQAEVEGFETAEYESRVEDAVTEAREEWADGIRDEVSSVINDVDIP